jgi:hypothetical protein
MKPSQGAAGWASLTERGLRNVAMQSGTNVRIFNDVSLHGDGHIDYDRNTGYFTLHPGIYRVDGWSLTSFGWQLTAAQQAATYSAPGYAFLWNETDQKLEALGSLQDPMFAMPSSMNAIIRTDETKTYYLAHQNGDKVWGISLQFFDPSIKMPDGSESTSHAFAQLLIQRIGEA